MYVFSKGIPLNILIIYGKDPNFKFSEMWSQTVFYITQLCHILCRFLLLNSVCDASVDKSGYTYILCTSKCKSWFEMIYCCCYCHELNVF